MRIGIFFGGPSREREISFAGGKTAFEHLDKTIFEPVPIFVDSFGRFIKVQQDVLYKQEIRDFFPKVENQSSIYRLYAESFPELATADLSPEIGELLIPQDFSQHFDFAFLAMHGPDCEDGAIQGLLEWYRIPYSGPGLMGSAVGIDKILQNEMIALANGQQKKMGVLTYSDWQSRDRQEVFEEIKERTGYPDRGESPASGVEHRGSYCAARMILPPLSAPSISAFFSWNLVPGSGRPFLHADKQQWAQRMANLDEGIGFPVVVDGEEIYHPEALIEFLDQQFFPK